MNKFEVGKTYQTRSACDNNCLFEIAVLSRTEKFIAYMYDGERRRSIVHTDNDGEYIRPDNYSMAPVFRAWREKDTNGKK